MEYLNQYAEQIGDFLSWISSPDTQIPLIKLLQGVAAVLGALISTLGFYKAWRYAESRLGRRLSEFLDQEERDIVLARQAVKDMRGKRSAVKHDRPKLFSNYELRKALKLVRRKRLVKAESILTDALNRTKERENLARDKAALHEKQRAMAHLLLGAIEDSRNDHRAALGHFQAALEIDNHDAEAMEYVGVQLLKLGDSGQALAQFEKLAEIAKSRGDQLLLAHAYRNCGMASEAPPNPSPFNANIAYRDAIDAFPQNGPPLDIAHIHELRGLANIKLKKRGQANRSLMAALARFSQLASAGGSDAREASDGVRRVHVALNELETLQNGGGSIDDEPQSPGSSGVPAQLKLPSPEQRSGQQPPNGERAN